MTGPTEGIDDALTFRIGSDECWGAGNDALFDGEDGLEKT